jgi:hypothetical protein
MDVDLLRVAVRALIAYVALLVLVRVERPLAGIAEVVFRDNSKAPTVASVRPSSPLSS